MDCSSTGFQIPVRMEEHRGQFILCSCWCSAPAMGWLESRSHECCLARSHPCGHAALGPHLCWAAGQHVTAYGDQLPSAGGVTGRVSSTVNVWGTKCRGRELRVGGRQIELPILGVSVVPRGSSGLGIAVSAGLLCAGFIQNKEPVCAGGLHVLSEVTPLLLQADRLLPSGSGH